MRRVPLLKKMLAQFGVEDGRVRLDWVSASEGEKYAAVINDMTEKVRALGPFKLNNGDGQHGKD
jgi:F420-non-reducing hydrogenase iron-sulfur subunit